MDNFHSLNMQSRFHLVVLLLSIGLLITFYSTPTAFNSPITDILTNFIPVQHSNEAYLVDLPGCKIVKLDPYDDGAKKYFTVGNPVKCKPRFSFMRNGKLTIDKDVTDTWTIQNLACCFRSIERITQSHTAYDGNADGKIKLSESCTSLQIGKQIVVNTSYIKVECSGEGKMNGSFEFHGQSLAPMNMTAETKAKSEFWNLRQSKGLANPPSILIIGIDSVSRLHLIRSLPQTREFLLKNDFVEMLGYTKVGINTFPNIMAGFGGMETDNYPCWPNSSSKLDDCPFIWKNFSSPNYITAMLEDDPNIAIFNYIKTGFVSPPVDYYLRPYMLALRNASSSCAAGFPPTEVITNFIKDFVQKMGKEFPYFLFSWMTSVSHDGFNSVQTLDETLLDAFVHVLENSTGNPDNTVIIFMSDHGHRTGKFRETFLGFYEYNLPAFYIRLPRSLKQQNPEWYAHLRENSHKLTNPLDLHSTIADILGLVKVKLTGGLQTIKHSTAKSPFRSRYSFFEEQPGNRTCESSAIPQEYCMCGVNKRVQGNAKLSEALGAILVAKVNSILNPVIQSGKCLNLTYTKFLHDRDMGSGSVWNNFGKFINYRDHLIAVEAGPSKAKLEAKLRVFENSTALVLGEVARLNLYGDQSHCMEDFKLKLYCMCKDSATTPKPNQ